MAGFREVSRWGHLSAYIQRKDNMIFTTNKHILILNDKNILKCMVRAGIEKSDLKDGVVYMYGFKRGTRRFDGFWIEDQSSISKESLSDYFNKFNPEGIEVREGETPPCFLKDKILSENKISLVGLTCDGGEGFLVNKEYHDYVLKVTKANKIFAAFPVIYALEKDVVAAICQINFFWDSKKIECDMKECFNSIYNAQKYCWNNLDR